MNRFYPWLILLLLSTSLQAQTNLVARQQSIGIDGYAAQVNNRVITRSEIGRALAPVLPELHRQYQGPALEREYEKLYVQARNDLIERALIVEAFNERGGDVPEQYLNDEISRIIRGRFNGDETAFEQGLSSQKMSRDEFKDTIREEIIVNMMMNEEVTRRARVTPAQVRAAYEEELDQFLIPEKVQYSVIALNRGNTPEDREVKLREAESIRTRLLEGADFNETAKEVSEGYRANEGGAFPWMQPNEATPELQEVLNDLPAGDVSEVIVGETDLYLVKVEARRQARHKTFEEVRQSIKDELNAKERERLKERWISRLRENSYIVIYDE